MRETLGISSNEGSKESIDQMVEYALLYDFYGALLKEKNRSIFEDYMFNDMSLAEIADEAGITRQGVSDIVRRSGKKLIEYEMSLGLIKKFNNVRLLVCEVKEDLRQVKTYSNTFDNEIGSYLEDINLKIDSILDEI